MVRDRASAQDDVPEEVIPQVPHRGHHPSHAEAGTDLLGLTRARGSCADDFLQRDDVRVHLPQHLDDAGRHDPAIHSPASMNIVGRDSEVDRLLRVFGFDRTGGMRRALLRARAVFETMQERVA